MEAEWLLRIEKFKAKRIKPLVSTGCATTKGNLTVFDRDGSFIAMASSRTRQRIAQAVKVILRTEDRADRIDLNVESNFFNFYAQVDGTSQWMQYKDLAPWATARPSSSSPLSASSGESGGYPNRKARYIER